MRKFVVIAFVLFIGHLSQAQVKVSPGLRGGLNLARLTNIDNNNTKSDFYIGGLVDIKFNKYFEVKRYTYVSIYGTMGYTYADLKNIHPQFNNGFYEWNIGLAYKRYFIKRVIKIID